MPHRTIDFSGIALNITRLNPEVIFIHASYDAEGVSLRRLRELGVRSTVVGSQRSDDPAVTTVAGTAAEELIFPQYFDPEPSFRAKFKEKLVKKPQAPAEYACDAMMVLSRSIQEATDDTADALRLALLSGQSYQGASGTLTLDGTGNRREKAIETKVMKGGKGVTRGVT